MFHYISYIKLSLPQANPLGVFYRSIISVAPPKVQRKSAKRKKECQEEKRAGIEPTTSWSQGVHSTDALQWLPHLT